VTISVAVNSCNGVASFVAVVGIIMRPRLLR